jgi:imidazolonepropionase-like amidohydrolase
MATDHTHQRRIASLLAVDMGMPAIKVISALTRGGATILGKQRDIGTIEP